jgi:predicted nucleotidyltransferase
MRISPEQHEAIVQLARRQFGVDAKVWLFGSRVDDARRGGDIDLLVELPALPPDLAWQAALLEAALQMRLGDQKIDVVLTGPENAAQPIVIEAKQTGVRL